MTRLDPPDFDRLSAEQQRVFDAIATGPRGAVIGPLGVWLHSPEFASLAQSLGRYCRYDSALPKTAREIAILTTAAFWRARYEWFAHARIAAEAGVPDAVIEAIRLGHDPEFGAPIDLIAHEFSKQIHQRREVCDALYGEAIESLGTRGVVDLVGLIGYYSTVAMTLNVFHVPLPPGVADPFAAVASR